MRSRTESLVNQARPFGLRRPAERIGRCRAFTLVELLVVIAIIGILVALLLPAIQAAREAGRRSQCRNHLKQLALGANNHLNVHKYFPTGGWGWRWAGDPNYGYDQKQPGGWMYNILPYIEEQALHDLGRGVPDGNQRSLQLEIAVSTPISIYFCPSRRTAQVSRFVHGTQYYNVPTLQGGSNGDPIGRNDYVACAGDRAVTFECQGPATYAAGINPGDSCWTACQAGGTENCNNKMNGITVLPRSGLIGIKNIPDGVSKTIIYGEKYLQVSTYETTDHDNDQGWNLGHDRDIIRWCNVPPFNDALGQPPNYAVFGSSHAGGMQIAMADGSIHTIPYEIDQETFRRLGIRNDKLPVQVP